MSRIQPLIAVLALLCAARGTAASGQCLEISPEFAPPGVVGGIFTSAVFDDGSGRKLYVGGDFQLIGETAANRIARWNGSTWEAVGAGLPFAARDLLVWDAGTGGGLQLFALVAFGSTQIRRWNGATWEEAFPQTPSTIFDLEVYDDGLGGGPKLFAAARTFYGGVLRLDGAVWTAIASLGAGSTSNVEALAVYDSGSGPELIAAGSILLTTGSVSSYGIARWNGLTWSHCDGGLNWPGPSDLAVWDDGSGGGPKLYVGGGITQAGTLSVQGLVRWDGVTWSSVGGANFPSVNALAAVSAGPDGSALYVGGPFTSNGTIPMRGIGRWSGSAWSALGSGLSPGGSPSVSSIRAFDDGTGLALYALGSFYTAGAVPALGAARWNGATWSPLTHGRGLIGVPRAALVHDDGSGERLYVAGRLYVTGATLSNGQILADRVVRWDGSTWTLLGPAATLSGDVMALERFDSGSGVELIAAGAFTEIGGVAANGIARWNGGTWAPLSTGTTTLVRALESFDDGSGAVLVAAGDFVTIGGTNAARIARWNGSSWSSFGAGLNSRVDALAVFDDGSGPRLYAAGSFSASGATALNRIARWDGTSWAPLGTGVTGPDGGVHSLCVFEDALGSALYVGGAFQVIGGITTNGLARWSGSSWSSLGSGFAPWNGTGVLAMRAFDDGSGRGPMLYVGGEFSQVSGIAANRLARWNGTSWSDAPDGFFGAVRALEVFDDGAGPSLFAVGDFAATESHPSLGIARLGASGLPECAPRTGTSYCAGDGTASACPCGNVGAPDQGCNNSSDTGGADLEALGQAHLSVDTVTLSATHLPASATLLFFQGTQATNGGLGATFGDGLRCVSGAQVRLVIRAASGGNASFGRNVPGDPPVSGAGSIHLAPTTRRYQVWYRDSLPFCTSSTFNLSNGLEIRWSP